MLQMCNITVWIMLKRNDRNDSKKWWLQKSEAIIQVHKHSKMHWNEINFSLKIVMLRNVMLNLLSKLPCYISKCPFEKNFVS